MTTVHEIKESQGSFRYKAPLVVLFLFLVSILFRIHSINDSIRGGHVWLSAHVVLTNQIWMEDGITNHHFSPIYTFDNDADRNMRSLASGISDEQGNYYYVSYAPFNFLFAYFLHKLTGTTPSMFSLQVINLLVHLLTSWMIYLIICRFYRRENVFEVWAPALVGSIIYLFSMHPMWCHTYVYFADTLVQLFWAAGLYMAIGLFQEKRVEDWKYLLVFGLLICITIYTEWIGVFFAAAVFLLAAYRALKERVYIRLMAVTAFATCAIIAGILLQYGSINGLDSFFQASADKYLARSGYDEHRWYFAWLNIQFIIRHYVKLYYPVAGMLVFLVLAAIINKKHRKIKSRRKEFGMLLFLICFPIIMHHIVFLGFTRVHDFALLKTSLLAAILIAIFYNRSAHHPIRSQRVFFQVFSAVVISLMLILSLFSYYDFIELKEETLFEELGKTIKKTSSNDEAIYLVTHEDRENGIMIFMADQRSVSPQVQMIAQRNILGVKDKGTAKAHMRQYGHQKGRLYVLEKKGRIINIEPLQIP